MRPGRLDESPDRLDFAERTAEPPPGHDFFFFRFSSFFLSFTETKLKNVLFKRDEKNVLFKRDALYFPGTVSTEEWSD